MTEYVRFSDPERIFGEKYILYGELGILNMLKRLKNYKKFRSEELILRLTLKKKIDDAQENLRVLDKLLPHHKMEGLRKREMKEDLIEENEALTLEQEIEAIRRKLERLQS